MAAGPPARGVRISAILAALILLAGVWLRLTDLTGPPLDFHPTRQLRSALIARGMYYARLDSAPEWQREMAAQQARAQELIEPQIMETLAAWTYRLAGGEYLWIPRLYAIFFWSVGLLALYLLARALAGETAAVAAVLFGSFWPYTVAASRAFQPDPLMTAAILWALWGLHRWLAKPGWGRAAAAGLLAGLAIYIKATAVFFILGGWAGLILSCLGLRAALRSRQVWLMAALAVLPYAAYHIYAANILGLLQSQFSLRFFPAMWVDPVFYLRWYLRLVEVVPLPWLLLALAGGLSLRERSARGLLAGLSAGYLVYALLFSYYTASHNYYHLPLLPVAALAAGAGVDVLLRAVRGPRWLAWAAAAVLGLAFLGGQAWEARSLLRSVDYRQQVARVERIAALFSPQDALVSMAENYSMELAYWGWLNSAHWFGAGDFALRESAGQPLDLLDYFEQQTAGRDYFLITDFEELARQPQVEALLAENFPLLASQPDYRIYDLRRLKP